MSNAEEQVADARRSWRGALDHRFCPGLLAPGVILIWIQCVLYARYIHVDGGITTIAINFSRCLFIVVACYLGLHLGFPQRAQKLLGQICIAFMTIASFLFFLQSTSPDLNLTLYASIFAGVGLAWGGGQLINAFVRLDIREATFYAFASMALSVVAGAVIAFVPDYIAYVISMLLPVVALVMYDRSMSVLDERESTGSFAGETAADDIYGKEPRSTWVRIAFGIVLFSFVLGASRGFPYGASIELPLGFTLLQFVGVAASCLVIIWKALIRRTGLRFSSLWLTQLLALAVGVILLATFHPIAVWIGATLIAITNLFQVAFLWFLSYDVARHRALPAFVVLGLFWFLRLFFRELGRLVILWLGPTQSVGETVLIAIMVCLLAASMAFLLTDDIPTIRPFFSDLEPGGTVRAQKIRKTSERMLDEAALEEEWQLGAMEHLRNKYHLTQRESEIAIPLSQGRSTTYIAATLFLSDNTVRTYVKNIYAKMDIHSKQDLIDHMRNLRR